MAARTGSIQIENPRPQLDCGRYRVKRVAGENVRVSADVFKEGHDELTVMLRWRQLTPRKTDHAESPMRPVGNDAWEGEFPVFENGLYAFTVEAWADAFRTWAYELKRKLDAGRDVSSELLEGSALLSAAAERAAAAGQAGAFDASLLREAEKALVGGQSKGALARALDPRLAEAASRYPDRAAATRLQQELRVFAERPRAVFSAWYELFPRSAPQDPARHGTFAGAERMIPYVEELGFDVIYLPPIHPIGRTARKGKNNSLAAAPDDVGSPWAIGSPEGGHKAIHPQLGTLDDFERFVRSANERGIEVALDMAFQCSPDHPYVKEHPEWFNWRPDGTLKTAENPPKRYEDIVNFDWLGPIQGPPADYMIGNLWPNAPDILPEPLQQGGRTAFLLRSALAATLSSSWGIYSGFELCENRALPGKEEYLDSEKYQLVKRDFDKPGNIRPWISALNRIRKEHPALQLYRNLRFHRADNERVLFYSKITPDRSSQILVAVSLDPFAPQEAILDVPLFELGIQADETYQVHELISGERALWQGPTVQVRLTLEKPAAIWSVLRFRKTEQGFDYYF